MFFECGNCSKKYKRKDYLIKHCALKRHVQMNSETAESSKAKKLRNRVYCEKCEIEILDLNNHLKSNRHRENCLIPINSRVSRIATAFECRVASYRIINENPEILNSLEFLLKIKEELVELIDRHLVVQNAVKITLEVFGDFERVDGENAELKSFLAPSHPLFYGDDIGEVLTKMFEVINDAAENFEHHKSGWSVSKFNYAEININQYEPLRGSEFIELPKDIRAKRAVINVKNNDNFCFAYAVLAGLGEYSSRPDIPASFGTNWREKYNLDKLTYPVQLKEIKTFLKLNEQVSVNVYGIGKNDEIVGPLFHCRYKRQKHVNLLFIKNNYAQHYCCITDLSRLVRAQLTLHCARVELCDGCLLHFNSRFELNDHINQGCSYVQAIVPEEDTYLSFQNFNRKYEIPFLYFFDFESILVPVHHGLNDPNKSETVVITKHVPSSFCFRRKCTYDDRLSLTKLYRGEDCVQKFVSWIKEDVKLIYNTYLKIKVPMKEMTESEVEHYNSTNICHICEEEITDIQNKVRDHCHRTGIYRSPAHKSCNVNYKHPQFIPFYAHNLTNYDKNFFFEELAAQSPNDPISVIPNTKEKYISFSQPFTVSEKGQQKVAYELRFLDSMRFLIASLESLVAGLPEHAFIDTKQHFNDPEVFELMCRKGVYPYNYIDSFAKYDEPGLPPIDKFYNEMNDSHASLIDYGHAKKVYKVLKCNSMGEYNDKYLTSDVVLLTDAYMYFRGVCIKTYGLDPSHYYTASNYSWEAMLKITKARVKLLSDIDQINFFKRGIRGGVAQCSHRSATANNKYMHEGYNPNEDTSYLLLLDMNNQYGLALQSFLPLDDFEWCTSDWIVNEENEEVSQDILNKILAIKHDSNVGYVFEVDLLYPKELHDDHNDMPFAPEKMKPPHTRGSVEKLILNLNDKQNYVIHYTNLQQCLNHGLKLKKIRRVIKFTQSDWLKPYVDLNTRLRTLTNIEFEKSLFKLFVNSIFGKTIENVEKHRNVHIVSKWKEKGKRRDACSFISQPNFHSLVVFSENLCAVELTVLKYKYNKPMQVGFCVLDIAKEKMYSFLYDYLRVKFSDVTLNYTDTDSVLVLVKTPDFYKEIIPDIESYFDTSDFPEDNPYGIPRLNKKKLGMMKDENNGVILTHFLGLRAKLYAYKLNTDKMVCKAKGVQKSAIAKLVWNDFKNSYENEEKIRKRMKRFIVIKNNISTVNINKIAVSAGDDKRFLLPNTGKTLAWGHYAIPTIMAEMEYLKTLTGDDNEFYEDM